MASAVTEQDATMPEAAPRACAGLWQAAVLMAVTAAIAGCGAGDEIRTSEDHIGRVVRNDQGDGRVLVYSAFILDSCGLCPRDPTVDWRSDFSNNFLGQGESCSYAPSMLVDGDHSTGWVEGDEGEGIGVDVVVPSRLDLTEPVWIWAGYGKSAELFAANGRPKRLRVDVLRVRAAEPDPHDATGCSTSMYVEPVVVAAHEVDLRDFNGYQLLPLPEFPREQYLEYPMEWLLMDGEDRMRYRRMVDAGEVAPFEQEPTDYAYLLRLTLLEVNPGTRYADTVITEIGNVLPPGATVLTTR